VAPAADFPDDDAWMAAALELGRREMGATWPNPAVGALVVAGEGLKRHVVGRGWTQAGGRPHAETQALEKAGKAAHGATLYVTLEPCSHHGRTPPCADAVIAAGIGRVVSAIEDPDTRVAGRGHRMLRNAGITVTVGPGAARALRDHAGHIRRVTEGRPQVHLKLALSGDGKIGLKGRQPVAITGGETRGLVHMMRARSDAIAVGIGTVLSDAPELTCRLPGMEARSPVRVVLDSQLRTPPDARLLKTLERAPVWIIAAVSAPAERERALKAAGAEVMRVDPGADGQGIDLAQALTLLGTRGITRLMVEGGAILANGLLAAGLVDEASLFRAPGTLGAEAVTAFPGGHERLFESAGLLLETERTVGADRLGHFVRRG
jgi:diaminohydroxyphosphoribosylaminopyrimidine deaminase/5-amino-6-(5-phosphoribosylamino)uracil reductase